MKITINVFLLKAGRTVLDALTDESRLRPISFSLQGVECLFYHQTNPSHPKWTLLFSNIEEVAQLDLTGRSLKALLVMAVQDRVFCFTFGHARHLIDALGIERYFGLRTALSLTDPLHQEASQPIAWKRLPNWFRCLRFFRSRCLIDQ